MCLPCRGGEKDYFLNYSAAGPKTARTSSYQLFSGPYGPEFHQKVSFSPPDSAFAVLLALDATCGLGLRRSLRCRKAICLGAHQMTYPAKALTHRWGLQLWHNSKQLGSCCLDSQSFASSLPSQ